MDELLIRADDDHVQRERRKAKELKRSSWWINRIGEGRCYWCGERFHPKELTMDHVTPLIRGGTTSRANCVPACATCNRDKENLTGQQWRAKREND
ncbi:MAG: HNH endonuclease [Magnetococcales bacterium]|nr:HNH endonuclease [Magnetococcales bacterium]